VAKLLQLRVLFLNWYSIESQPRFLVYFNRILMIGTARTLDLLFWIRAQLVQWMTKNRICHQKSTGYVYMVIHRKVLFLQAFVPSCKKVKVKQFYYRPGQALRFPGGWSSQISKQLAHECGKVVSPMHRPPLPSRKYSWYSFLLEAESTPGSLCGRKDYVNEKIQWHHRKSNPRSSGL
jgi:hypothetical protein